MAILYGVNNDGYCVDERDNPLPTNPLPTNPLPTNPLLLNVITKSNAK
jgi:hypothetical protein